MIKKDVLDEQSEMVFLSMLSGHLFLAFKGRCSKKERERQCCEQKKQSGVGYVIIP